MAVEENQKYGKLTTICVVGRTSYRVKIWKCLCDCGNYINVPSTSLSSGNTKSCGCLHKKVSQKNGKEHRNLNRYELNENKPCFGYTRNGEQFIFDYDDYEKINEYTWSLNPEGYVISLPFGEPIRMHRLIMDAPQNMEVDHINHNPADNRKENLRIVEHYENITYSKTRVDNTSGRKGVYWDKSRQKWMAAITFNKKTYHLGRFENFEDAVRAREEAEKTIHKEFHYDESQNEERGKAIS